MAFRRKTVRRLAIIAAVAGALGGAADLVVHHRQARREAWLADLRASGMLAYDGGDYALAADSLDRYLALHDTSDGSDDAAVLALAISASRANSSGYQNLQSAQQKLQNILKLHPGDIAAEHALLELCPVAGDFVTTERITDDILSHDPQDSIALESRVNIRLRQSRFEDALLAAQQRAVARPTDLDARLAVLQLMMHVHKPAAAVTASAAEFGGLPGDPANLLLHAIATDYAGQHDAALAMLREASSKPTTDTAVTGQIVNLFDVFKQYAEATAYLQAAVVHGGDVDLQRGLALRYWQQSRFDQILTLVPGTGDDADATVLGLKAAAFFEANRSGDAAMVLNRLRQRTERVANAWSTAIDARYTPPATPAKIARQLAKALSRDPDNGVIRSWLGDCYNASGESTLAIRDWSAAAGQLPGWAMPCQRASVAMLRQDRWSAAVQAAASAYDRTPNTQTALNLAGVRLAAINASPRDLAEERDLLEFVEHYQDPDAATALLPVRVTLLARTDRRAEAQAAIDSALAAPDRLDSETAVALLNFMKDEGLAGEDRLLTAVTPQHGSPALMVARANWLARQGKVQQAANEMAAAALLRPDADDIPWRIADCQFLDSVGATNAYAAWRKLARDYPSSPAVQNSVCSAAAVRNDMPLVWSAVDRLHELTGDGGEQWRLQRARLLIDSINNPADAAQMANGVEAVSLLTDIVREAPAWLAPRLELARALVKTGNAASAVEHLKAAAALDPTSVATVLDLEAMLRQQGRGDEVPRVLRSFTPPVVMDDTCRVNLAAAMADAGQSEQAVTLLVASRHSLPAPGRLLLAEQYRQIGDAVHAGVVYDDLLAAASPSPAALASAAEFYATHARSDLAKQTLQRLAASGAAPQDIAIATGRFEERFGSEAIALDQFKKAADTQTEAGAVALIDFHLRHGHTVEAATAARQAVARMPGSRILNDRLIETEAASARAQRPGELRPLIDALSHDPARKAEVAALTALSEPDNATLSPQSLAGKLKQIAAEFPADLPLAQQAVALCIRQQDADGAALVARQTMTSLPNDPAAARLAVDAMRAGHRWAEMRIAAEQWQSRLSGPSIDATSALAESMLGAKDTTAALAVLQPFRDAIASDPRSQPQAATVLARVLLTSDHGDQAIAIVTPLFRDAAGRRSGRDIARSAAPNLADAISFCSAIDAATPASALEEQNDQADLLADVGRKFDDRSTLAKAIQHYHDYLKAVPNDNDATLDMAGIEQQLGDLPSAEAHLRGLLTASPSYSPAKNDLACLLLTQDNKLEEAEHLARSAVAAAPNSAAFQDTLARVLSAAGRTADARVSFQIALRLDPNLVPARVGLARLMRDQGDMTSARTELRRVDGTLKSNPRAGEYVADELSTLRAELTQLDQ